MVVLSVCARYIYSILKIFDAEILFAFQTGFVAHWLVLMISRGREIFYT